ncbi:MULTISPECIES: alpha,alpha-trehalose-phosphate synthase (UDP-forming) [Frankiaceae]|uniref:Glucosylglycerol-phosphate synthase n=1 Tax=Candidatus Protofrankia datiscae TaxID=2716812 RepID=F8AX40_9ACTN|nr:trehalose-6-phosphate synthase [Protofrankia symbiont of Coriaria myrtifolia]AEH11681.1 Glucosylglycerol-phosphate synthase [Candidatus Protofrankia datiscae]
MLVASNRGPVAFATGDDGSLVVRRGGGGLVSGLHAVASGDIGSAGPARSAGGADSAGDSNSAGGAGGGLVWVCAALSEADRRATRSTPDGRLDLAGHDTGGAAVHMLDVDRVVFDRAYNAVANRTLWFVLHLLYAPASQPSFDAAFQRDWQAYEIYNAMFAEALAREAAPGAAVLIQDYHLTLVPAQLRNLRPDLRIAHFSHTPWAPPEYFRILPDDVARAVIQGMLGADRLGFLTPGWAEAFCRCAKALLPADVELAADADADAEVGRDSAGPRRVGDDARRSGSETDGARHLDGMLAAAGRRDDAGRRHDGMGGADGSWLRYRGRVVRIGVHPLGVDGDWLLKRASGQDVAARATEIRELAAGRRVIVRVDRTELSKNIVRGLDAYRELLRDYPQWQGRVVHIVCAYPSRHDLPEYREYTAAVQRIVAEIEDEFATATWLPVRLEVNDDYPRSLAALSLAEVLVVNPIRDGMNLVAKEGAVLSRPGAALVLSREAGACVEMADDALVVNPFDVSATARALHTALLMAADERRDRCARLAAVAGRLPPRKWFRDQLDALLE